MYNYVVYMCVERGIYVVSSDKDISPLPLQ